MKKRTPRKTKTVSDVLEAPRTRIKMRPRKDRMRTWIYEVLNRGLVSDRRKGSEELNAEFRRAQRIVRLWG